MGMITGERMRAGTLAAFAGTALVWGSSFLFIKVALESFSAGQVAIGRLFIGALTLVVLMAATRRTWPRDRRLLGHLVVVGLLLCLLPFLLFAYAGQFLPSGLSAILNATTPIWTALFVGVALRAERFTAARIAGVLIGAMGVAVVAGAWRVVGDAGFAASIPAQLACLGATACYGAGFAWMRRFVTGRHPHDPVTIAAAQVTGAALLALLVVPFVALGPIEPALLPTLSLLALGALGTGFAYAWSTRVVVEWGSVPAASVTYITPVIGVALGVLLLGERLSWNQPVGAVVVLVGVVLVQRGRVGRVPTLSPAATAPQVAQPPR